MFIKTNALSLSQTATRIFSSPKHLYLTAIQHNNIYYLSSYTINYKQVDIDIDIKFCVFLKTTKIKKKLDVH